MALKAVIFDMDGTLVDSMPYHTISWQLFLKSKGLEISDDEFGEKGHGTLYDIMPRFFGPDTTKEQSYQLGMEKEALYREMYLPFIEPIEGLLGWLNLIKAKNLKIGLATAADNTNTDFTLDSLGIRQYFDTVVTSDNVNEGKPSPAVYLYAAEKLNVPAESCLVFEDTFVGVSAARAAGMKVIAITTLHKPDEWAGKGVSGIIPNYQDVRLEEWMKLFE